MATKKTRPAPKASATAAGDAIRIRMYRVGFGDCFLLTLPTKPTPAHILVDCGVHSRGEIGTPPGKIADAVQNVFEETGGKLALVIATHAHQDHISGFATCEKTFVEFEVGEVWLPWTEDPKDATAVKLKQKQAVALAALAKHFAASPPSAAAMAAMQNLTGNPEALRLLKAGIHGGKVSYLSAGKSVEDAAGIAGLSAQVLGPPRDEKFLARMDPPADERFLRLGANGRQEIANAVVPFERRWVVRGDGALNEKERAQIAEMASDPEALAFALDQALNNTSVVTLFTFRGKHLLFPGDAQYGNWQNWMGGPTAGEMLAEVDFYKVAHHGSFNATPKVALQKMTKGKFGAMVSTQNVPWNSIPLAALMTALTAKASGVVRSDSIPVKGAPKGPVVAKLPAGFRQGEFWYDYFISIGE